MLLVWFVYILLLLLFLLVLMFWLLFVDLTCAFVGVFCLDCLVVLFVFNSVDCGFVLYCCDLLLFVLAPIAVSICLLFCGWWCGIVSGCCVWIGFVWVCLVLFCDLFISMVTRLRVLLICWFVFLFYLFSGCFCGFVLWCLWFCCWFCCLCSFGFGLLFCLVVVCCVGCGCCCLHLFDFAGRFLLFGLGLLLFVWFGCFLFVIILVWLYCVIVLLIFIFYLLGGF